MERSEGDDPGAGDGGVEEAPCPGGPGCSPPPSYHRHWQEQPAGGDADVSSPRA